MHTLISISQFPYASTTIDFGNLVASAFGSDVTLLTVRATQAGPKARTGALAEAREHLPIPPLSHIVRHGNAEAEILSELRTEKYDLLVIGAREHRGSAGELLLGDVTHRLVRHSPISALVVRGNRHTLKNILVCTGGPPATKATVTTAASLARATGSRATLLHVAVAVPSMYTGLAQLGETLPELLQTDTPTARHLRDSAALMRAHKVEADLELRHGIPANEILRAIERSSFDLLVIGASARQGLDRLLLDEVSLKLVDESAIPVLVVRHDLKVVIP
jgi:nucleotide-binding universal stress UspA family protein